MKLIILDQVFQFTNKQKSVKEILHQIDLTLKQKKHILSNLIIDGIEIYDDYEEYILKNIEFIEEIEVDAHSTKQMIKGILEYSKDYIQRVLPFVKNLGQAFYKSPSESSWESLGELFGGIQWLLEAFSSIDESANLKDMVISYEEWNEYVQYVFKLKTIIPDLNQAVETEDLVLIADILNYEIVPLFENMLKKLQLLVPEPNVESGGYVN